jgi:hypothetical protein
MQIRIAQSIPSHFSQRDASLSKLLLKNLHDQMYQYNGNWTADWLLSELSSNVWTIGHTRSKKGSWSKTYNIGWDVVLPDGSLLTDPTHAFALNSAQKAAFLSVHGTHKSTTGLIVFIKNQLTLLRFLYDRNETYNPDKYGFAKLDSAGVNEYMSRVLVGGTAGALGAVEKTFDFFFREAVSTSPAPFTEFVDKANIAKICDFLQSNGFYKIGRNSYHIPAECIDRKKLGAAINIDSASLDSVPMNLFLRQFEPDYETLFPFLLAPTHASTEYCSNRTPTIDEAIAFISSESTCKPHLELIDALSRTQIHLPDSMPDNINLAPARKIIQSAAPLQGTPWPPINVALRYTNEALRIIIQHGDALADLYIDSLYYFAENELFNTPPETNSTTTRKRQLREDWLLRNVPDSLGEFNISGWSTSFDASNPLPHRQLRRAPRLSDLISVLMGAIAVLIGITKPIRESELRQLEKDCVDFADGDGFWLTQYQGKRGTRNHLPTSRRPIPAITAKAISIAVRISDALADLCRPKSEQEQDSLFYLLPPNSSRLNPTIMTRSSLADRMNLFCDHVGMKPDAYHRRWYIRVHELRKSFLISFFWLFRHNALDAARWLAGHAVAEHIWTYIEANFPGDELPVLEAEYINFMMSDYETFMSGGEVGISAEARNIDELYEDVCRQFNVARLSIIPSTELQPWLEDKIRSGSYSIQVFTVGGDTRNNHVEIAFRLRQHTK